MSRSGTMVCTLDGPSKVAMDCTEVDEGYKVRYTPLLPGDYYMSIKYNNSHIVGSPFKITCAGMTCNPFVIESLSTCSPSMLKI